MPNQRRPTLNGNTPLRGSGNVRAVDRPAPDETAMGGAAGVRKRLTANEQRQRAHPGGKGRK
jgi:hypothetical protein